MSGGACPAWPIDLDQMLGTNISKMIHYGYGWCTMDTSGCVRANYYIAQFGSIGTFTLPAALNNYVVHINSSYGGNGALFAIKSSNTVTIGKHPSNKTASIYGSATFDVVAGSFYDVSYQWYQNNTLVPGANASTFTINNASSDYSGIYCVISNGIDTKTTNAANLFLSYPSGIRGIIDLSTNLSFGQFVKNYTNISDKVAARSSLRTMFINPTVKSLKAPVTFADIS